MTIRRKRMKRLLLAATAAVSLSPSPIALAEAPAVKTLTVSAVFGVSRFQPGGKYPEALTVTVAEAGAPKAEAKVTVKALDSRVRLRAGAGDPSSEATAATSKEGKAAFGVDTRDVSPSNAEPAFALLVTAEVNGSVVSVVRTALLGAGYESSFLSDRVSSEVFLGTSLARAYDDLGKSKGFHETSFVGRLHIDTLWTRQSRSAFHTGLELQFSSFPTTSTAAPAASRTLAPAEEAPSFTSYADSFTGSFVLTYQPPWRWATHYSETSRNRRPELRFDALRVGFVARLGLMSRDVKRPEDGDSDLRFLRAGLLVTHHQTHAAGPEDDNVDVFPMRYVEISYGRYEQIFDQHDAHRLVVEAGLRLPGIGNDAIPFYAGLYANAGRGQDDLRVFAGLLFHVNKLVELFQKQELP